MDMLNIHTKALDGHHIAYHELLLYYTAEEKLVYGLVEGRDDPCFYRGIIDRMLPAGWNVKLICAGNKDKVLRVLSDMDWERFPRRRVCFFVDRDLSDFVAEPHPTDANLYVTDKYSIESEIVCELTFERTLEEVLGLNGHTPHESRTVRALFHTNLGNFCDAIAPIMAQAILWRRAKTRACLDNIKLGGLFLFDGGRIALKPQFSSSKSRIQYAAIAVDAPAASENDIAAAESEFRSRDGLSRFTRGKYLVWFFVQLAKHIHQESPKLFSKYKSPPKARIELGALNALAFAAPRARCPESLNVFFDRTFVDYAKSADAAL
jgi:hypothetical protein